MTDFQCFYPFGGLKDKDEIEDFDLVQFADILGLTDTQRALLSYKLRELELIVWFGGISDAEDAPNTLRLSCFFPDSVAHIDLLAMIEGAIAEDDMIEPEEAMGVLLRLRAIVDAEIAKRTSTISDAAE